MLNNLNILLMIMFLVSLTFAPVFASSYSYESVTFFNKAYSDYIKKHNVKAESLARAEAKVYVFLNTLSLKQRADLVYHEPIRIGFTMHFLEQGGKSSILNEYMSAIDFSAKVGEVQNETLLDYLVTAFQEKPFLKKLFDEQNINLSTVPLKTLNFLVEKVWDERDPIFIHNFETILKEYGFGPQEQRKNIEYKQELTKACLYSVASNGEKNIISSLIPIINEVKYLMSSKKMNTEELHNNIFGRAYNKNECELVLNLKFRIKNKRLRIDSLNGSIESIKLNQRAVLSFDEIFQLFNIDKLLLDE